MKQKTHPIRRLMLLAAMLFSITASAYDFEVDGIYYNVLSLTDLTCGVTSGDAMYSGEITIPEQVTYNKQTFSVTTIETGAFENCSALISLTIGNSVTSIEDSTFSGCSCLESLIIEDGLDELALGCNFSSEKGHVGQGLFYDCPLKKVYLGRNLSYKTDSSNGYSPFCRNESLTSVIIGNSVTSIGYNAFYYCRGLTSLTIGNSVTTIGNQAFYWCSSLNSVTIPNSVTSIRYGAFWKCHKLSNLTIGNSVTSIESNAFASCWALANLTIGNSVTSIGDQAFYNCSKLTSVSIPNSVTSIGGYAFFECSGLTDLTIGKSVATIEKCAFDECSALESITSLAVTAPEADESTFSEEAYANATLYIPTGSLTSYQSSDCWKKFLMEEVDALGVKDVKADKEVVETARYSLDGKMLQTPTKGMNIVKMNDGTTKKVLVK